MDVPRKAARMIRKNKHSIVVLGVVHKVLNITTEITAVGQVLVFDLGDGLTLRRTPGSKLDVL
jgi:hypothetical protein